MGNGRPDIDWEGIERFLRTEYLATHLSGRLGKLEHRFTRPAESLMGICFRSEAEELDYVPGQYVTVRFHETPRPSSIDDRPSHDAFTEYAGYPENVHYVPTVCREEYLGDWNSEPDYVQHTFLKYFEDGIVESARLDEEMREDVGAETAADFDAEGYGQPAARIPAARTHAARTRFNYMSEQNVPSPMPSRIEPIEPGGAEEPAVNRFLEEATEGIYEDSAFFGAMAHCPGVFQRIVKTLQQFPESDGLDVELLELMRLRIAAVHRCAYCGTVRTKSVEEDVAPKEDAVFGQEIDPEALTRRETLAVRIADDMSKDPQRMTDDFIEECRTEFTDGELVELLLFSSLEVGLDRFCIALRLDTTGESPYPTGLEYPLALSDG